MCVCNHLLLAFHVQTRGPAQPMHDDGPRCHVAPIVVSSTGIGGTRGLARAFAEGVHQRSAGVGNQALMQELLEERWWVWQLAGVRMCEHWSRYGGPLDVETLGLLERLTTDDLRDEIRLRAKEVFEETSAKAAFREWRRVPPLERP